MPLRKLINDILTGPDNKSYDYGRVLCICSFITYYLLALVDVVTGVTWTPLDFAGGIGAMAVGFGVSIRLSAPTEPPKPEPSKSVEGTTT